METTTQTKKTGSLGSTNLVQAWLVLTLALFFGASLAGVQATLGPRIEANKRNETLDKVPELVWGAAADAAGPSVAITPQTIRVSQNGKTVYYSVYRVERDGSLAGWVVKAGGQGYADRIETLIGLDPQASRMTGLFILEQKETPGLGNKIVTPEWRGQFVDKATDRPLVVTKARRADAPPSTIDAVTGATISSASVTRIVNQALSDLKAELVKAAAAPSKGNG